MKTSIDKNFGITGIKVDLNLPDLYLLKHTSERINCLLEEKVEKDTYQIPSSSAQIECVNILENLNNFIKKLTKEIQSPEDSNIFEEDKEDEIVS